MPRPFVICRTRGRVRYNQFEMKVIFAIIAALLVLAVAAVAQFASPMPKGPSVTMAPVAPVTVATGSSATVEMSFRVAPGFHINSNQPKDEFLLPTALKLDPPSDIVISGLSYPPGEDRSFAFAPDQKLNVYAGDFSINGKVSTTRSIAPGSYRVRGMLTYQACDNAACFPPRKLPVDFDVKVVRRASSGGHHNPGQSPHVH